MNPKNDNQESEAKPDVTVDIPHEKDQTPPAPTTAPPLPRLEPLPVRPINIMDNITPPPTAPITPPVSLDEFHEHEGRRWPVILIYIILAFVVALLVFFGGRWIYHKTTYHPAKTIKPGTSDSNKLPSAPPTGNQQSNSGSATSSSASGAGQSQTNGKLPNNGPGNVAATFVGVAIIVGGLHYIYTLRREH